MKCRKALKMLPLLAGNDLPPSRTARVENHLARCSFCRRELEQYKESLHGFKTWYEEESMRWKEGDWSRIIQKAASSGTQKSGTLIPWPYAGKWAVTLMAAAALILAFLFTAPDVLRQGWKGHSEDQVIERGFSSFAEGESQDQEVVSMTFISRETGLKIVWFLDKKFNLEDTP